MIRMASPHPSGAAISLLLRVPARPWVLLRRLDDDFTTYPDAGAVVVVSGETANEQLGVLDFEGLTNGIPVWYQIFAEPVGGVGPWEAYGALKTITPAYESQPSFHSLDPVELIRERLEVGLAGELALGTITHKQGAVPVLRAPPLFDSVVFPAVTVLLESRNTEHRFIGDSLLDDAMTSPSTAEVYTGWFDRSRIQIAGWSLNAEERAQLRHAIERILILNLPILDATLTEVDVSQNDQFDAESYAAPVYQAVFELSALHPAIVRDVVPLITSTVTEVTAIAIN
jgi:hypothetical protein